MWFYEALYTDVQLGLKGRLLCKKKSRYQDCRIYQTDRFGRILVLDGIVQTTEMDEYIYHEMLTHPLFLAHPKPKNILVIGGGDGGVLREALKHRVKEIYLVEIDKTVIDISKKYLPSLSEGAFDNRRVKIIINDGAQFVRQTNKKFDVVIIDSSDPIGPAKSLFSKRFYHELFSVLKTDGMMICQSGSTILQPDELRENSRLLKQIFPFVAPQVAAVPTYIGGFFSFVMASKRVNLFKVPARKIKNKYSRLHLKTKYYNPDIHFASTILPNNLRKAAR